MSSACFKTNGSSSGWRTHSSTYKNAYSNVCTTHHTCTYNRLPEDEPSGLKHVEDIKN